MPPLRDILARCLAAIASPRGVLAVLLAAGSLWVSWPALRTMGERWSTDPRYAHGYLVPAFAVVLLWLRRSHLGAGPAVPSWWGLPLLAAGCALQVAGGFYFYGWLEAVAI